MSWFIQHSRFHKDIWGLFDGFTIDRHGATHYIQVKSNSWPSARSYLEFVKKRPLIKIMLFNVRDGRNQHDPQKVEVRYINNPTCLACFEGRFVPGVFYQKAWLCPKHSDQWGRNGEKVWEFKT